MRTVTTTYDGEAHANITLVQLAPDDTDITLDLNPLHGFLAGHFHEPCILDDAREAPPEIRRLTEALDFDEELEVNDGAVRLAYRLNTASEPGGQPEVSELVRQLFGPNGQYEDLVKLIRHAFMPQVDYESLTSAFHLAHLFEAAYPRHASIVIGQDPYCYLERRYPPLARDAITVMVKRHHHDCCFNEHTPDWQVVAVEGALHITPNSIVPCGQFGHPQ